MFIHAGYGAAVLRIPFLGFATVSICLSLTACSTPAAGGPVDTTFLKRANDACSEALTTLESQPFPYDTFNADDPAVGQLPAVGAYFDGIAFNHKERAVMTAIGRPSQGRRTWTDFVALVGDEQDAMQEQITAAKAPDKAAFVASVHDIQQIGHRIDAAAVQVGFGKSDPCVVLLGTSS